jgi:gliding motility-associated-like protein
MKHYYSILFCLASLFQSHQLRSQSTIPVCPSDYFLQKDLKDPILFQKQQDFEEGILKAFSQKSQAITESNALKTIPTVTHIVHNGGPENLSDAQVQQGIQWLNQALSNTGIFNQGSGIHTDIQLCFAQRTPNGLSTNGITRTQNVITELQAETQDIQLKNLIRWQPKDYLNIWIVKGICSSNYGCGIVAYAYYPYAHGSGIDGIVIEADYLTDINKVSSLAHELGHYLGLYHTFKEGCINNNCLIDGDRICDTPPDQSTAFVPCSQIVNTCSTDMQSGPFSTDQPDMTRNFMDYGKFFCLHDFTADQSTRMNATLEGVRKSLLVSKGCLPPCPANTIAAFSASATTILTGETVNFTNTSQNAGGYTWTVNGIPFGNQTNASYTFLTPGTYNILLTAQPLNTTLCDAENASLIIQVNCAVTASFEISNTSPDQDETIFLTNTSQNTLETEWLVNGVSQGATLDSISFSSPGAYEIRLITGNGVCADTITDFVYVLGICLNKTFELTLNFSKTTYPKSATFLTDGNLLVTCIGPSGSNEKWSVLTKMKPDGEVIWVKEIYVNNADGNSFVARGTPDGGFVAFWGEGDQSSATDGQFYLTKFNSDGAIQWSQEIEWNNFAINVTDVDILVKPDGTFYVCGPFLAKFAMNGNPIWVKSLTGSRRIRPYPGGGFLVLGADEIYRYNEMGTLIWYKRFLLSPWFVAYDCLALPNGSIFVSGIEVVNAASISHGVMLRLSASGDLVWSKKYRQSPISTYLFNAMMPAANGNIIIAGSALADEPGPGSLVECRLMLELDPDGNLIWSRHRAGKVTLYDMVFSPANSYVMVGESIDAFNSTGFWVLKTDEKGRTSNPTCQELPYQIGIYPFDPTIIGDITVPPASFLTITPATHQITNPAWILDTICPPACLQSFEICNNNIDDDGDGLFDCLDAECSCSEDRCAPKQANIWYFGENAGLNFSTDPPTVIGDGKAFNEGISATMCDVKGKLLFYTDGKKVYNRFHQPMPNGDFFYNSFTYQCLIVPNPKNTSQYYVFVNYPQDSIFYSLVDMSLDAGRGDLVPGQKKVLLTAKASGLAAVKACSFQGFWLVTRTLEVNGKFLSYRLDANGLNTNPVVSNVSQSVGAVRQLKLSPDGQSIACSYFSNTFDSTYIGIYRFDPYTSGLVSNPAILGRFKAPYSPFGVEFSPSGQFLYTSGDFLTNVKLAQYDLNAGDLTSIINSRVKLATLPGQDIFYLQLAPNGKIYGPSKDAFTPLPIFTLGVINKPNLKGLASLYEHSGLDISAFVPQGACWQGLCNIIASYFVTPKNPSLSITAQDTICELNTPILYQIDQVQCGVDSIIWKVENLDAQIQPNYQYATIRYLAPGNGRLITTAYTPCGISTDTLDILVVAPLNKTLNLGPDQVVCQNGVFSFNAGSGFARYQWSDGTADSTTTTTVPGKYWVNVWDLCGNFQTDTILVSVAPNSVLDLGADLPQQCSGFTASYQRPANFVSWQWSPNVFLNCNDCPTVTISPAVSASWEVVGQTADGCISVDTLRATIRDTLLFSRDTFVCAGQTLTLWGVQLPADTTATLFLPSPALGCDTLLTIHVLGVENAASEQTVIICANAFYDFNGTLLPADTVAIFNLPSAQACDSVVTIRVNSFPPLNLTLPMDTTIRIGASVLLNAVINGTGNLDFVWSPTDELSCFTCPDPLANPLDTITYTLAVTDANGCTAQESVTVRVNEECRVRVPNAFTPNGDGANDVFRPIMDPCLRTVRQWKIINRWGQTVFEQVNFPATDPQLGWDGNWEGKPQASDVLIWVAEFEYFDGRRETQHGDVTLVR